MSLFLIKIRVNPLNLIKLAAKHGHFSAYQSTAHIDQGYLMHRLLAALFEKDVPKCFFAQNSKNHQSIEVLFYHKTSIKLLLDQVKARILVLSIGQESNQLIQLKIALSCIEEEFVEEKDLSAIQWDNIKEIGISVTVPPISRTTNAQNKISEIDSYLLYVFNREKKLKEQTEDTTTIEEKNRFEVYKEWFQKHINQKEVCHCESVEITSFKLDTMQRKRTENKDQKKWSNLSRPVIEVNAKLKIKSPEKMNDFLLNGIGRHQAFGFGMLKIISFHQ